MAAEIERKFLTPEAPAWLEKCESSRIEQGYLALTDEVEVRLRRRGEDHLLTVKRGRGEVREEVEIELQRTQFEQLWPLTEGRRLTKTRYLVPLGDDLVAEVDVYAGELEGLIVTEVEFESERGSGDFDPPAWIGEDVSGEQGFANQALAKEGRPPV